MEIPVTQEVCVSEGATGYSVTVRLLQRHCQTDCDAELERHPMLPFTLIIMTYELDWALKDNHLLTVEAKSTGQCP